MINLILLLAILTISVLTLVWLVLDKAGFRVGQAPGRKVLLDTCALIDGRIVDIAKAGFVPSQLLIPRAVVRELQYMADQSDSERRERARFGLDVVRTLQETKNVDVKILPYDSQSLVDEQLIELAKRLGAMLYTTDYNLNKVAQTEAVAVLNVNELAQALRPRYLPGEKSRIKLVQAGNSAHQAVGYLDDGTMVVVEHAKSLIGREVPVVFTRVLQTEAGKMMFATTPAAAGKAVFGRRRRSGES